MTSQTMAQVLHYIWETPTTQLPPRDANVRAIMGHAYASSKHAKTPIWRNIIAKSGSQVVSKHGRFGLDKSGNPN
ncbi:hypothetical protein O9993_10560 [Vibrio lentus]|nr:hypothetical protein [Vibrio lentus]